MHRLLHANGWLYRVVHKQHHEFKATTVWASEYFGIVDMVLNILPGAIPAIAMKSHFMVLMLFTAILGLDVRNRRKLTKMKENM